jgi:hypothetical protein
MNDRWKLRRGREDFKQFIIGLLASQARCTGLYGRDLPFPPQSTVTREAMLDRFLMVRPDLAPFSAELACVYPSLTAFCVNSTLWDQFVSA